METVDVSPKNMLAEQMKSCKGSEEVNSKWEGRQEVEKEKDKGD